MMNIGKRLIKMLRRCWFCCFKIYSDILKLLFLKYFVIWDLIGEYVECKFLYIWLELEVKKIMCCFFELFYFILVFYVFDLIWYLDILVNIVKIFGNYV